MRFAFLFPGQASQFSGMGRELYETHAESREVFDTADRVLEKDLSRLCFEGSDEQLAFTENTQPAILTVSVAALRALEAGGVRPVAAAGHSLGEYAAHVAAGSFEFGEAVAAVRSRGRFMQQAVPLGQGAMAAILGLDIEAVRIACEQAAEDQVVQAANINGPLQIVIAGHAEAVQRAMERSLAAGARRALPLAVSAPFHCSLMRPAAERLRPLLDAIEFRMPAFPVYSNVDATPADRPKAARDALIRQVASPVRWNELIENMLNDGIECFVEVGPGKVLAGLVRGIRKGIRVLPAGTPEGVRAVIDELGGAAR